MLFRLVELKPFCKKYENVTPELRLTNAVWADIDTLLAALKPIKILTKQVQSVQMTLSDFYGYYVKCRLSLSKMTTNEFAQLLSNAMNVRQNLFSNNVLLTAVYLDPRYQVLLTKDDKKKAQKHLLFLHKKINKSDDTPRSASDVPYAPDDIGTDTDNDVDKEFEIFLSQMEKQSASQSRVDIPTGE